MAKKVKRVPPSRIRYVQSHPTVSCRVAKEIYDRLMKAKEVEGKSFADILKIGLGIQEVQDQKVKRLLEKEFEDGWQRGYASAKEKYKVTYHCSKCGQVMEVQHPDEKQAIEKLMRGWSHGECPPVKP